MTRDFGWWHWEGEARGEADVPQIMTLREFAKRAGLIRKANGRLHATQAGRRATSDPDVAWREITGALAAGDGITEATRELLLVRLLKGDGQRNPSRARSGWCWRRQAGSREMGATSLTRWFRSTSGMRSGQWSFWE